MQQKDNRSPDELYGTECRRLQREHDIAVDQLTTGVTLSPDEVEEFFLRSLRISELMLRQYAPEAFVPAETPALREVEAQERRAQFRIVPKLRAVS